MRKLIVLATVLLASVLAPAAGATTGPAMLGADGTIGVASNTGSTSGNATSYPAHVFGIAGFTISIPSFRLDVISTTTNTATVRPTLSGCEFLLSGTPQWGTTCSSNCDWRLSVADSVFDSSTGSATTTGTLTFGCPVTFDMPTVGCFLQLLPQTAGDFQVQNINATGGVDTSATPWGMKGILHLTGLTFTSNASCLGLPEHGSTGAYIGTFAVHNLFGKL